MNRKTLLIFFTAAAALVIGLTVIFSLRALNKAGSTANEDSEKPSSYDQTAVYLNDKPYMLEALIPYISLSVDNLLSELDISSLDWDSVFGETDVSDYVKQDAIEILRLYTAIEAKAEELGITWTKEEREDLDNWHADAVKTLGSEEAYQRYLEENKMTEAAYQHIYAVNLLYKHLFNYYYGDNGVAIPTQEETDAWGLENSLYHINHIFLATQDDAGNDISAGDRELQLALANSLLKRIQAGEDFDALAKEFSSDGGMQDEYLYLDEADEPFLDALQTLNIGDVSGVVESEYGYHIIKREPLDVRYVLDNYPEIVTDSFNKKISEWTAAVNVTMTKIYDDFDVSTLYREE